MTAHVLDIDQKVWVDRGYESAYPYQGYTSIADIGGLPEVVWLSPIDRTARRPLPGSGRTGRGRL